MKLFVFSVVFLFSGCCDASKISANTKQLYSSKASEKNQALLELAKCGEEAKGATQRIGALLYDENVGVQSSAAYALREIDTPESRKILERAQKNRGK
jgi:HEAT repeat protein